MKIGIWAYLDNNIGDDLMVSKLLENFPQHEFLIYTNDDIIKQTFTYDNLMILDEELMWDNFDIDAFISIGGSIFNNLNTIKGKIFRLTRIRKLKKMRNKGIKIYTIGCNLGPYDDDFGKYLTKKELELSEFVTVRDKSSYNYLKQWNLKTDFEMFDDIVFSIESMLHTKKEEIITLGVSAYRSKNPAHNNYKNYFEIARICDEFVDKENGNVKLFAFDSENENDLSAAFHIKNMMNNKDQVTIVPYLGDIQSFLKEFQSTDLMISIRFHASVLAMKFKIPFVPISYSIKMDSLINDFYKKSPLNLNELHTLNYRNLETIGTFPETYNAENHFTKLASYLESGKNNE